MQEWEHLDYDDFEGREPVTILYEDTVLEGELNYNSSLKIKGKFKGKILTKGFLWVDKGAEVDADIEAKFIKLAGTIKGNLSVVDKLEILEGAKLFGNVKTSRLKISEGTVFEGKCEMTKNEAV